MYIFCLISIFEATPLTAEDYRLFGRFDVCGRADRRAFLFVLELPCSELLSNVTYLLLPILNNMQNAAERTNASCLLRDVLTCRTLGTITGSNGS